jgi:hypothetical protein
MVDSELSENSNALKRRDLRPPLIHWLDEPDHPITDTSRYVCRLGWPSARVPIAATATNPISAWMEQIARNLTAYQAANMNAHAERFIRESEIGSSAGRRLRTWGASRSGRGWENCSTPTIDGPPDHVTRIFGHHEEHIDPVFGHAGTGHSAKV